MAKLNIGETITLFSSAVRATAVTNQAGTAVSVGGGQRRFIFVLAVTAAAAVAGDTLSVYIDWSLDNSTWYNGCRFTTVLGNGGAKAFYTVFDARLGTTADVACSADQAANVTVPTLFGAYVRGRYTLVDGGAHGQSFTFSLVGFAV